MFRCFFALFFVAAITIVARAESQEDAVNDVTEFNTSSRSIQGKAVAKIIAKIAAGFAASCILEAGEACAQYWKQPKEAINCAKKFFADNKGRCAIGK